MSSLNAMFWGETSRAMTDTSEIERYFDRLFPLFRSITGEGVRETLEILSEIVPMSVHEVPSGTEVFDWTVPGEWVVHEAYLLDPEGNKVVDIRDHNLHLLNYSAPFEGTLSRQELEPHLYTNPDHPEAIPYVTSYYERNWGFCLAHNEKTQLPDGTYEVCIDTEFKDGVLNYGEAVMEGASDREILISTNVCHPSMANNELSGPLVSAFLYRALEERADLSYTYRFVYVPETIGALAFLDRRGEHLKKNLHSGFTLTCVGDEHPITYKKSPKENSVTDRAATYVLRNQSEDFVLQDFHPLGSDERQYCSPGFDLPVGCIMRSPPTEFEAYHTSLDNKELISFEVIGETIDVLERVITLLEQNDTYVNKNPHGEPFLSKYDLISGTGAQTDVPAVQEAALWLLNQSDGTRDLIDIASTSGVDVELLRTVAEQCEQAGLLEPVSS